MKIRNKVIQAYKLAVTKSRSDENTKSDIVMKTTSTVLLSLASLLLSVLNIVKHYTFMMYTTLVLTVGFGLCAFILFRFSKVRLASSIMSVLVAFIFSVFALTGGNEGFSILWILIVPPIGMNLIGILEGTMISAYFQVFLAVLFYTPLKSMVVDYYTPTFMIRFPLLYLTCFASAVFLTAQKEYYFMLTEDMAYIDALTGLNNRRYYEDVKKRIKEENLMEDLSLISIDVNRLKYINDKYGHDMGDKVLMEASSLMRICFSSSDAICRIGGDEFEVVTHVDPIVLETQISNFLEQVGKYKTSSGEQLSVALGKASSFAYPEEDIVGLEKIADDIMYSYKRDFYIQNNIPQRGWAK